MQIKQATMFLVAMLFAAAAYSGEKVHHKTEVKLISDDGDGESVVVIDSDDLDFDLHSMQVGENNAIVDRDGRNILVTRTENGFTFDVDGKAIEMPSFEEFDGDKVWVHDDQATDVNVHVVRGGILRESIDMDGVMIFSGKEIDESTQQVIRTALETAGHSNVSFAGGHDGGEHQVRVIKKVHEVHKVTE